ncbi:ATP-binding cassette domain-containing protein [Pusillimonas sp. TS35]|uniref:ABC transporter ATP-binding protein n=1 Tax=Paracandidimonas lactea TaxID=2895524 RepID=UPI00136A785E|nr:ABC transporter ATP-binding protein [Paracandidimonas lactea]MYN13925.1 ATP-binding cassette domain-containing protein [Pusillimonas sp. TS35]
MPLLEVSGLHVSYGDTDILFGVDLNICEGEIVAIVGSNGAGKTTLLKALACLHHGKQGVIKLDGTDMSAMPAHRAVESGVVYVPEGRRLFPRLSVRTNLELGAYAQHARPKMLETLETVYGLFPKLAEREGQLAGTLSGGEQQMCAIGRGLMSRPRLLLIDEVSLGLAPVIVSKVYEAIAEIRRLGTSIILVEQNVRLAFQAADRGYVINHGKVALEGPSKDLNDNPEVKRAYLGM